MTDSELDNSSCLQRQYFGFKNWPLGADCVMEVASLFTLHSSQWYGAMQRCSLYMTRLTVATGEGSESAGSKGD